MSGILTPAQRRYVVERPSLLLDFVGGGGIPPNALAFTRASAAVVGRAGDGLLVSPTNNVFATTHDTNGKPLGLLIEAAATQFVAAPVDLTNVAWGAFECTATAAGVASPFAVYNATTITRTGAGYSSVYQTPTGFAGGAVDTRVSIFAKAGTSDVLSVELRGGGGSPDVLFNLTTGVVTGSGFMVYYGDGWWRCYYNFASYAGTMTLIIGLGTTGSVDDTIHVICPNIIEESVLSSPVLSASTRAACVATVNAPDGTYDITINRASGATVLSSEVVSGGFAIPVSNSPVETLTFELVV